MSNNHEIIAQMDVERFTEVLAASPKKFREDLFRGAGIRIKSDAYSLSGAPKNRVRSEKFLAALKEGQEVDEELLEELLRNYLYTRRTLLADALDYLGVQHEEGLTDEDLSFIDDLPLERGQALKKLLEAKHPPEDVALYLAFMRIRLRT